MIHAIGPRNELETMLAMQMVGIHNLAMKTLERATLGNQHHSSEAQHVNAINKISRTFIAQLEALNKLRDKGQHKMTVEHIHVNEGGHLNSSLPVFDAYGLFQARKHSG